MSSPSIKPAVLGFPFLVLSKPIEFGDWWLGPLESFDGPWMSLAFEEAARSFFAAFRDWRGEPITGGALLARELRGADGKTPTLPEHRALTLAVGFGTIAQNPYWSDSTRTETWRTATTDNADFWVQPLDLDGGWISLGRGSRVSITEGGTRLSDEGFAISAPLELHMPFRVTLDDELVHALYKVLLGPAEGHEAEAARLRVAVRWLLRSWQNTPSITSEDRLVFIKVATEALTGEESTSASAKSLEALFNRASEQEGDGIGSDDLLWQPEGPTLTRDWTTPSGKAKSESVSEFTHWYSGLGDARNALLHGEDGARLHYDQPDSRFTGPFVEIGDRITREAIAVLLGECGYPAVWRRDLSRASFHVWKKLVTDADDG